MTNNYNRIEILIKNLISEYITSTFLCKRYNNIILPELNVIQLKVVKNREYRKAILRISICKFNSLINQRC